MALVIPAEQIITRAEQAFGGEAFTVGELIDYLKAPLGEMPRIERAVRRATVSGLLIGRPRVVGSKVQIEHVPVANPRAPEGDDAPILDGAPRVCVCGNELPPSGRKWCSERCRKTQYRGGCMDCGGPTSGAARCKSCGRAYQQVTRAAQARARRAQIESLWAEGLTANEIAVRIGVRTLNISGERARGLNLPHRRSETTRAEIVAGSERNLAAARASKGTPRREVSSEQRASLKHDRGGAPKPVAVRVRDAVLLFEGDFSLTDIRRGVGTSLKAARRELDKLLARDVVVEVPIGDGLPPRYQYNNVFPAGPTRRPRHDRTVSTNGGDPVAGAGRNSVLNALPSDARSLVKPALSAGWALSRRGSSHVRLSHPDGRLVTISSTPSDRRALQAIRADLRRAGALNAGGRSS